MVRRLPFLEWLNELGEYMTERKAGSCSRIPGTDELMSFWSLRILRECLSSDRTTDLSIDESFLILTELGVESERIALAQNRDALLELTSELLGKYISNVPKIKGGFLQRNLRWLQKKFELKHAELTVLALLFLSHKDKGLREQLDKLGPITGNQAMALISTIVDLKKECVKEVLNVEGKLIQLGLLKLNLWEDTPFLSKFKLLESLLDRLALENFEPLNFSPEFERVSFSELKMADFSHLLEEIDDLKSFIATVCQDQRRGVNILIYGPQSSGKTQFIKALGDNLNLVMYEFIPGAVKGESSESRLQMIMRAQSSFFGAVNSVMMIDDAHTLFEADAADLTGNVNGLIVKRFIKGNLGKNLIPTIWITNRIDLFDYRDLVHFDYCMEFKKPPRTVREEFIKKKMIGLNVSQVWASKIAAKENLSFETIEKIALFTKTVCQAKLNASAEDVFSNAITRSTIFIGGAVRNVDFSSEYEEDLINADVDLARVVESLKVCRDARLCLYGPPGSGKSGFAYHLARQLDIPLIVKKGSDILGRYLGESEQNLANAFSEAQSKSGLLLIDEIDGLLADRSGAQRNWEISIVNELLTQVDNFKGILIVTTNFFGRLDSAAMRRFDLKVKFDYLKSGQVLRLWKQYSDEMLLPFDNLDAEIVQKMNTLTPGDFANIKRQSKFLPVVSMSDFLSRLQKEVAHKNQSFDKGIGFLTCQI